MIYPVDKSVAKSYKHVTSIIKVKSRSIVYVTNLTVMEHQRKNYINIMFTQSRGYSDIKNRWFFQNQLIKSETDIID